jgi:diguanylate cyclase (GGDEF)-like protein
MPRVGHGEWGPKNCESRQGSLHFWVGVHMKVLIAEDDSLLREMLRGELAAAGHQLIAAANGLEAWEMLQREHIRMLLVDWMMPGLDGPELIRRIRGAGWPGYTYIILLTAKTGRDDIVEGLNVGADDYVTKPFRRDELVARMGVGARILDLETRLSESLAREEALASQDSLTGLPNRRALYDRARAELSRARREKKSIGVIMMDIDNFKPINDKFGHATGDEALRRVAEVLQKSKRDYDFTGRWGGDEFLAILPGTSILQAGLVAERIRAAVGLIRPASNGEEAVELRTSLGVACASPAFHPIELDELLHQADGALYRAKAEGRNRVCLHSSPAGR